MISDRIKKLTARINAMQGPEGRVYIIKYLDGIYTCRDPEKTWKNEDEFAKWENTLKGQNTIIIDNLEHAIKHPEECRERRKKSGMLTVREVMEDAARHPEEYRDDWLAHHVSL